MILKSYTTVEQSKKLAEFLTNDTADMEYIFLKKDNSPIGNVPFVKDDCEIENSAFDYDYNRIPCWSIAALLDAIPQEIFDGAYIINITEGRDNRWVLTYDHYTNRNHSYYGLSSGADNLIDACYELILKLHEQNLL